MWSFAYRVAQGNPEAERRGRPLDQTRLELQRHDGRPIADADLPVGPPLDLNRADQREVPHGTRFVPQVDGAVHLHLLTVAGGHRRQIAQQEKPCRLIGEFQGHHFTPLKARGGANLRVDRGPEGAREVCLWLCDLHLLVALDPKLMHCTHDVSF